jgi:hypothetical protein
VKIGEVRRAYRAALALDRCALEGMSLWSLSRVRGLFLAHGRRSKTNLGRDWSVALRLLDSVLKKKGAKYAKTKTQS